MSNHDPQYQRIYTLPERLRKARIRVIKATMRLEGSCTKHLSRNRNTLIAAERRVRDIETEARQYNFLDLIDDG